MIPNLTVIIIIMVTTPALILLTFLPAFIELKKPKDSGPRLITTGIPEVNSYIAHFIPFANMEDGQRYDCSLNQTMAKIISFLPSLEA
jgi:hypothetical protein